MQKCFLLCIDENENVFKGMILAIKSLERTNPGIPIAVFYYQLNEEQKSLLKNCILIKVDYTIFDTSHRPDLGRACCFRFYINKLKEYGFNKAIYIDCDIVVFESLDKIFNTEGNLIAVGRKRFFHQEYSNETHIKEDENLTDELWAFNSGVICFDLDYWGEIDLVKEILSYAEKYKWKNFLNPVNALMYLVSKKHGGFTSISSYYNFLVISNDNNIEDVKLNTNKFLAPVVNGEYVKVLHWNSKIKFWDIKDNNLDLLLSQLKKQITETAFNRYYSNYHSVVEKLLPCFQQFENLETRKV